MKVKTEKADIGIIVGRFQVHELHEAHKDLIDSVLKNHDRVMIFLGLSAVNGTINNPLDFEARKIMIQETYPEISVYYITDTRDDANWSKRLDEEIEKMKGPERTVVLYGSRDSFIGHYTGKFRTVELESTTFISGTEIRKRIHNKIGRTKDFRAGAIWATAQRFPTCFPTVDIAIFSEDLDRTLLARKEKEDRYRFVGGFADPQSKTYEDDAKREVAEETGLEIGEIQYVGSRLLDDWRYRGERDKIKTMLFWTKHVFGHPNPMDDINELKWFDVKYVNENSENLLVPEHIHLWKMLVSKVKLPI